jgi:hypothetical protein
MSIRTVNATRYVTPLREGGSLPAIIEADDDGMYVLKFRGAGQGPKALIAELIGGEVARAIGLPVPEIVFVELDPELARTEPDPEIQDLIKGSAGLNLALDYLPGSITFDPLVDNPDPGLASSVVWLDALISNVDRTPRNPNILTWHKKLWLIDHGASLYFHHAPSDFGDRARRPFPQIKDHVLLPFATQLNQVDEGLASRLSREVLNRIVGLIPEKWLSTEGVSTAPEARRQAYAEYLTNRLHMPREFVKEAWDAR